MIVLAELQPYDPVDAVRKTLRATSANDASVTGLNSQRWLPAISSDAVTVGISLFKGDFDGRSTANAGAMKLRINRFEIAEPYVRRFNWAAAPVKLWAGVAGQAWPWTQFAELTVSDFSAEGNGLSLSMKVNEEPFSADVLTAKYAGTGGIEGGADLKGKVKPFLLGRCSNVEPVLIDAVNNVYQVHGYAAIEAVTKLYERGSEFPISSGDYANYTALTAATIANGRWATCIASGLIRLGAPAYGVITADVDGDKSGGTWRRKPGEIMLRLLDNAGVTSGLIESSSFTGLDTALASACPTNLGRMGIYITEQASVLDLAARIAAPCNAQVGVSLMGKIFVVRAAIGSPTLTLDAQQRRLPRVISSTEAPVSPPWSFMEFGYARSWRVHTLDEISYYTTIIDLGRYDALATYREGNIVDSTDGSRWIYINATPTAGNAPPTWPTTTNTWWENSSPPTTATINFNANNDRNATTPTAPTISGGGAAFSHVLNTDGSADVTFNWNYTTSGVATAANNIDGFRVYLHSETTGTDYVFGSAPATETVAIVTSGARAMTFPGVPADSYYTIGVQAFREVDSDIDSSGFKASAIIKSTASGEHPYRPSSTVTFDGNVSGEVNSVPVATLTTNAANGATAYTGTTKYRTTGAPTNNPAPSSITITANTNGTRNIRIDWGTYTQGANQADFLLIFWKKAGTAPGVSDSSVAVRVNTAGAAYFIFEGVNPADAMSFGIAAARRTENGLEVGTIQAPTSAPTWVNVTTATPDYTANINGSSAATVVANALAGSTAATNFNANNDRNGTTPTAPTLTGGGVTLDHTLNTDSSADISFEWNYTTSGTPSAANNIDGFLVYVRSGISTDTTAYTFGTTPVEETIYIVPSDKRAFVLPGVPANRNYTFGVKAYRAVDTDIDATGMVASAIVKSAVAGENPYRPSASVAFAGDITGTVNSVAVATVTAGAANGATAFTGTALYRTSGAPSNNPSPTGITITENANGTRAIKLDWGSYTQGARQADFLILFWKKGISAPNVNDSSVSFSVNTSGASYYIMDGLIATDSFSFGIAAARRTENGLEIGTIQAPTSAPTWVNVATGTPNYTANVGGTSAATVVSNAAAGAAVATNFNANNDRNATTPTAPVLLTDLTAIDHTINTDGSANISIEWTYTHSLVATDANNIDGFLIYIRSSTSASTYTFGTTVAEEVTYTVPYDKRALVIRGVPADLFYTIGVQAYRSVDSDIDTSGVKRSSIVKATGSDENPYRPSPTTAFAGDITGTVNGTAATTVTTNAANGAAAFTGTSGYRTTGTPSNNPTPSGITITANTNGTRNIRLDWSAYTQGARQADLLIIFWNKTTSAPGVNDSSVAVKVNAGAAYYVFEGVNPADNYSFGIAAARRTENGMEIGSIQAPTSSPAWVNISTATANYTANINAVAAVTITTAITNFNTRNDRDGTAISAPTIATNGTAVDHTINTDGSADISLEWTWGGVNTDIDGWEIMVVGSTSSSTYTQGTTPAIEQVFALPPDKRAFFLYGVAANLYWTFAVRAKRIVDPDVNAAGYVVSGWSQPSAAATGGSENPYRPSANVAFAGDISGTVGYAPIASGDVSMQLITHINSDTNATIAGQKPVFQLKRYKGSTDVSATATWAVGTTNKGPSLTVSSSGLVTVTGVTAGYEGYTIVTSTYEGVVIEHLVTNTCVFSQQPFKTSRNLMHMPSAGVEGLTSTTLADIGPVMLGKTGPNGNLRLVSFWAMHPESGTFNGWVYPYYRPIGGSWTSGGGTSPSIETFDSRFPTVYVIQIDDTFTGLSANTEYELKFQIKKNSGTGAGRCVLRSGFIEGN